VRRHSAEDVICIPSFPMAKVLRGGRWGTVLPSAGPASRVTSDPDSVREEDGDEVADDVINDGERTNRELQTIILLH